MWTGLLICISISCVDTIELDLPNNEAGRIVVEGFVSRSDSRYVFHAAARRSIRLVEDQVFELDNAEIMLLMDEKTIELPNNEPVISSIRDFHNQYGGNAESATFTLRVRASDGRVIESLPQRILEPPALSSLEVGLTRRLIKNDAGNILEREFVELFLNSPLVNDQGDRLSLLWEVNGIYSFPEQPWTDDPFFMPNICYVPVRPFLNDVNVVSSADINLTELMRYKIHEQDANFHFHNGYLYTVILKTVNTVTAEYWKEVAKSLTREGTLFDTPPGKIRTNLRNSEDPDDPTVLGYFYTAGIDTVRYFVKPAETGFQRHLCNPLDSMEVPCCSCLEGFPNSSLEKPPFWP